MYITCIRRGAQTFPLRRPRPREWGCFVVVVVVVFLGGGGRPGLLDHLQLYLNLAWEVVHRVEPLSEYGSMGKGVATIEASEATASGSVK